MVACQVPMARWQVPSGSICALAPRSGRQPSVMSKGPRASMNARCPEQLADAIEAGTAAAAALAGLNDHAVAHGRDLPRKLIQIAS